MQELTSVLDIPCMSSKTFNNIRKEVNSDWETTALACMKAAAEEEKLAAVARGDVGSDGIPEITVVTDGCWSKRSYKTNYNALSGAASIVGNHTGKILFISVKNKFCLVCAIAKNKKTQPGEHACFKNFSGPSTQMEALGIAEGFEKSIDMFGIRYKFCIADGDSSVYTNVVLSKPYGSSHPVERIRCKN